MVQRLHPHPYLALFNGPDTSVTTAVRDRSTMALQALYLLNNPFVHDQARRFAGRLIAAEADASSRLGLAYLRAFSRPPTEAERDRAEAFSRDYERSLAAEGLPADRREGEAWAGLARALARLERVLLHRLTRPIAEGPRIMTDRTAESSRDAPSGLGPGGGRRAGALPTALDRRRGERRPPAGAPAGPLPGEGEAPDRLLHDRRVLAPRHVRLQAEAPARPRQDRSASNKVLGSPYRFRPRGECGQDGQRAVRARRRGRRRLLLPAHRPRRLGRALGGDPGHAHRLGHDPAAEPRLVDQLRPGHAEHQPAVVRRARRQGAVQRLPGLGRELPARLPQGRAGDPRPRPPARRQEPGALGLAAGAGGPDAPRPERGPPLGPRRRRTAGLADDDLRHRLRPDARGPRGVRHRPRIAPDARPLRRRRPTTPARSPLSA